MNLCKKKKKRGRFTWPFNISPIKISGTHSTEVQLNCRHAVNTKMPILRAGPTLTELATRIFQSLSVRRVKWQHLRTLVIFLAVRSSRAAAGGKSLANSLVVPFSFWKAAYHSQGLGLTEAGAGFQNLELAVTAWWDRILMKNVSPGQPVLG